MYDLCEFFGGLFKADRAKELKEKETELITVRREKASLAEVSQKKISNSFHAKMKKIKLKAFEELFDTFLYPFCHFLDNSYA